ncbi:hypothetical protein I314_02896 [Cryptococcus bacillisporus CA1873]|uniref:Uncharacterized protein n=1 Tax=Cryptococcus bacillisporus CA1873 TaxID=1296111 RepID=A0ABR5BCT2_CRYGA|nr:hypothetical protein I314_02896 [Cryptococcus bacillisporus CA1873]|eukprot:KIR64112.1 hypothetical protein I314_02896 [Cryptococcus gattii CA1873]
MSAVSPSCHEAEDDQKPRKVRTCFATHVSIQLMTTKPLTIEHRENDWLTLPQSILSVKAVRDETPIR